MAKQESNEPGGLISRIWNGITKDGTLAAFGRQGADEIGTGPAGFPGNHPCGGTGNDPESNAGRNRGGPSGPKAPLP